MKFDPTSTYEKHALWEGTNYSTTCMPSAKKTFRKRISNSVEF